MAWALDANARGARARAGPGPKYWLKPGTFSGWWPRGKMAGVWKGEAKAPKPGPGMDEGW